MEKLPRFYVPPGNVQGEKTFLPDSVVGHAVRTLRMRPGQELVLFDGSGVEYRSTLTKGPDKQYTAQIKETFHGLAPHDPRIFLYQAPMRKERWEWLLEKATEIGIFAIIPLMSQFVEVDVRQQFEKKLKRWNMIVQSACEQCGRSFLPRLLAPVDFEHAVLGKKGETLLFFEKGSSPLKEVLSEVQEPEIIHLFVGPEGGFSVEELAFARINGGLFASLGKQILRSETAGLAAGALIHFWFS